MTQPYYNTAPYSSTYYPGVQTSQGVVDDALGWLNQIGDLYNKVKGPGKYKPTPAPYLPPSYPGQNPAGTVNYTPWIVGGVALVAALLFLKK